MNKEDRMEKDALADSEAKAFVLSRLVLALHWCWVYIVVQAINIPFFLMERIGSGVAFWAQDQLWKFKRHQKLFKNKR